MSANLSYASEREYAVKAGFIFNFARYSEGNWFNPNLRSNYIICSYNPDFVLTASKTLIGQKVKNRQVEVHLISREGMPDDSCNSFFLTEKNSDLIEKVTRNESLKKTMLVGEMKTFVPSGGHINLFITGGKVRFEVDSDALLDAGIKMSSKVLRLGRVVEGRRKQ
ncbi:YfiR family protein [Vibrio sp. F74]|uniref:YfiR family protein n=1 Tax=Vibrio sp. F74 TaxID=700020 RepID=UPI0035F55043